MILVTSYNLLEVKDKFQKHKDKLLAYIGPERPLIIKNPVLLQSEIRPTYF